MKDNSGSAVLPCRDSVQPVELRHGASLPHWRRDGGTYAVTFRLADSLPQEVLAKWVAERDAVVRRAVQAQRPLTDNETRRLAELHSERVEAWLDAGHGSCALRDPRIAKVVRDAMFHFHGERYQLVAWCVMPNHAHAVVSTFPRHDLSNILRSWKGCTGKQARVITGTVGEGAFWQHEPYDHLVRGDEDFEHQARYVLQNPEMAGLRDWPWVGRGTGHPPGGVGRGKPENDG